MLFLFQRTSWGRPPSWARRASGGRTPWPGTPGREAPTDNTSCTPRKLCTRLEIGRMFSGRFVFIVNDTERSNNMIKPDYWSRLLCIEVGYSMKNTSSSRTREHPSPRNQPPATKMIDNFKLKWMINDVWDLPRHCRTELVNQKVVWIKVLRSTIESMHFWR